MLDSKECHLRSLPCTRSRTSPSCASTLHAENPLASITRQKPQQGLMLVHHLSSEQQKRESQKQFVITIPPRLLAHHQVGCGCYRTPHSTTRCITSGRFAGPRSTAVWLAGPSGANPGAARLLCTSELGRR